MSCTDEGFGKGKVRSRDHASILARWPLRVTTG
jgi:hypothetical protein